MKHATATPDSLLLRVADACALTNISRTTAYELIGSGQWPVVKIGRAVRIPREALHRWIERAQQAGAAESGELSNVVRSSRAR